MTGRSRHRLNFVDQLAFELFRITRRNQLMQCIWIYDREVDLECLTRVCQRLCDLPLTRLIEPSPLPFGRPRWVQGARAVSVQADGEVLPRSSLLAWANTQALLPLDPVNGPGWRIAVQRFSDGSSAVSLTGSHVIIDGVGALSWIQEAIAGGNRRADFDSRQTRHPVAAVVSDGWQAVKDLPAALLALLRLSGFRQVPPQAPQPATKREGEPGEQTVDLPRVAVFIDAALWDQRARSAGGHTYSLLAALAARIAGHMDRRRPSDGAVSLLVTVNQRRGPEDDRAIAITFCKLAVDPLRATEDLKDISRSLRSAVRAAKARPDPILKLFPLVPWMPRSAIAALIDRVFTYADDVPVSCSNLGTLPASLGRVDGTPCSTMLTRAVDTNVTLRDLRRSHGHLVVVSSRFNDKVCISVEAWRLDANNSPEHLRDVVQRTLSEFELEGVVEC